MQKKNKFEEGSSNNMKIKYKLKINGNNVSFLKHEVSILNQYEYLESLSFFLIFRYFAKNIICFVINHFQILIHIIK